MWWNRLKSIWASPDLRKKILITLGILVIYRLAANIPVPGISPSTVNSALAKNPDLSQIVGLLSIFSGGSIQNFSIVSLGVYPYITASIVIQLLQQIVPSLERIAREGGEAAQERLSQITRYLAVPLAFLQGFGQLTLFASIGAITASSFNLLNGSTFLPTITMLITLTAGVMFVVWLGELITENGIGNGISILIFVNILSPLSQSISQYFLSNGIGSNSTGTNAMSSLIQFIFFLIVSVFLTVILTYITLADRRVPVQYPSKNVLGARRAMLDSSQRSYIPVKLNMGGMIPLIFAQSIMVFPMIVSSYLAVPQDKIVWLRNLSSWMQLNITPSAAWYPYAFFVVIIFFTFFYAETLFEQQRWGENLRKQGAFVTGYRPGEATESYLRRIMWRVTLWGALSLALISVVTFFIPGFKIAYSNSNATGFLTAASLIIVVQVGIDTIKQVEANLLTSNYSGFLS